MTQRDEQPEWRVPATRIAPLIDGEEYYPVLRDALINAQHQVIIAGWDLHTEIELLRGKDAEIAEQESDWPYRLADLLLALVQARDSLHIRLLIWEGASMFLLERQHLPRMKWPWDNHPRIELVWDRDTPRLSSHHQKFVVIDDCLAFAGGMDLTAGRWDSHEHHRDDPRRQTPGLFSSQSQPYHDATLAFDGEAARAMGDWARERWQRATGEALAPPAPHEGDPWPQRLEPVFRDRILEIALTQPDYGGRPEKRQVEATYITQIQDAQDVIYIESQYLTVRAIVDALCERLRDSDGPEVIIVLPHSCPGALQAASMDPRRDELLDQLRDADPGDRFGAFWATLTGGNPEKPAKDAVYIHAKTMVVDDTLLRIGSANLNNRSMGLDTELDLTLRIPEDDLDGKNAVAAYRRQLIAYLLHTDPGAVAEAEKETGSVLGAIDALRGGQETLHPFHHRAGAFEVSFPLSVELADPDRPLADIDADHVLNVLEEYRRRGACLRWRLSKSIGIFRRQKMTILAAGIVLLFFLLWTVTPLKELADRDTLRAHLDSLRARPGGMAGLMAVFTLLATTGFPVSLLIAVTGAMLDVAWALPTCLLGVVFAAFLTFNAGRVAPRKLRNLITEKAPPALLRRVQGMGVLGVVILRHIPVAPFAVVNMACGAAGVSQWRFLAGTGIGMLPSILLMTLFGREVTELITNPTPSGLLKLAALLVATITVALLAERFFRKFDVTESAPADGKDN